MVYLDSLSGFDNRDHIVLAPVSRRVLDTTSVVGGPGVPIPLSHPVRQRWAIPGRVRFDIPRMRMEPALAPMLETRAMTHPGVGRATANPLTGSLLVVYEASSPELAAQVATDLVTWLRQAPPIYDGYRPRAAVRRLFEISDSGPEQMLAPGLLTGTGYLLNTLQGLSFGAIVSLALGDPPSLLARLWRVGEPFALLRVTAFTLVITAASTWAKIQTRKAWRRYAERMQQRLRDDVFQALENQDTALFDRHGTGEILSWLLDDVATIGALAERFDTVIESLLTIAFASVALVAASPSLGLIALGALALMTIPVRALGPKAERDQAAEADARGRLHQALENILGGVVEVKSFTAESVEARRVAELGGEIVDLSVRATSIAQTLSMVANMFFIDGYTLAMSYAASRVLSGRMSPDDLNQANFWYPRLVGAVGGMWESAELYTRCQAAAERLNAVLETQPSITSGPQRLGGAVPGEIVLRDVSFGYAASTAVLHEVSFRIPACATVGIVGPSGSGKSTVLRLLLRLYDPTAGQILLNGHDLRAVNLQDLRASIALVAQEPYLFNDTVLANVRYGRPDASDEDAADALRHAGAAELATVLPDGLQSQVGERGQRLSGGQRQRVAIARALIKRAPIIALDEPTAHLDYLSELNVFDSLKQVTAGSTVILVAHRLANVKDADHIVVLDQGVVREEGDHQSLIERHGLYYEMWQLQDG